jgi:AbrB family looped-hinge helix DNA binding protein
MDHKKLFGTATVGTKGQVVIPVEARAELNIKEGDRLYVVGSSHKGVLAFFKEDMLETFIEKMNIEVENLRALKNIKGRK